ncbi:MAG: protein kinase [Deltaproteobacteria bacterium]|nr:protein kinase [Deltaproteobacteria bacterium]
MTPTPGAWINESIELVAPIAEGAMGKVWVAYHHRLRTRVAVKFVHEKAAGEDSGEALRRFEQEAALASQIKSPHVVQTYDSGATSDGEPYIVMELLEGRSLGDRLRNEGPLGWSDAAVVVAQVARALTKAHELGIVHRDIKPDNIFLCRSDEGLFCKVLDFGIAKQTRLPAMGGLTTDGKIVGTPEFMSPELVLEDRSVDYRADLWALAVVLYVSVTGQLPYQGKTLGQLCLNLVNKRPPAPSLLRSDLPPGADTWFLRALNRDAKQRFGSARDMALTFAEAGGANAARADLQSPTLLASTVSSSLAPPRRSIAPPPDLGLPALPETPTIVRRRVAKPLLATLAVLALGLVVGAVTVLSGGGAQHASPVAASPASPGREEAIDDEGDPVGKLDAEPAAAPSSEPSATQETREATAPAGRAVQAPTAAAAPASGSKPASPPATATPKAQEKPGERDLGF